MFTHFTHVVMGRNGTTPFYIEGSDLYDCQNYQTDQFAVNHYDTVSKRYLSNLIEPDSLRSGNGAGLKIRDGLTCPGSNPRGFGFHVLHPKPVFP